MTQPAPPTAFAQAAQPAPAVTSNLRPGYKTTELAIVVLTDVGLVISASESWLPPRYAAIGVAIGNAAYAIARGLAKLYPPKPTN